MKKTIISIVIILIVVVGLYYVTSGTSYKNKRVGVSNSSTTAVNGEVNTNPVPPQTTNNPNTSRITKPTPKAPAPTPTIEPNVIVNIENSVFVPSKITIKTGTNVTWINSDATPHTITSDSGGLLNSKNIAPGQSFSFTFDTPGTSNYHCSIHPKMKGAVIVQK